MKLKTGILAAWVLAAGVCLPAYAQGLPLEQVIREVCANSDSAKMMRESTRKTDAMITEKWGLAMPTVTASVNAARMYQLGLGARKESAPIPASMANTPITWGALGNMMGALTQPTELPVYSSSISVSQPLFTFGKIGTGVTAAHQYDSAVERSRARSLQQLQLQSLDAFYQVVLADLALYASRRSLDRKKELSGFLKRNFDLGSGNKAYLLAAQAELNSQYSETIRAEQNARTVRLFLTALMGRPLSDTLRLDTTLAMPALLADALPAADEAVKQALVRRDDLKSIGLLAETNRAGVKIYNAMYLPSIGFQASLGTQGIEPGDLVDREKRNWTVGVGLQWTLFDGMQNRARARQYQSDMNKLLIAHEGIRKLIEIEVLSALSEYSAADSNLAASRQMLESAQEGYALTNDNFRQGSGQFSDLQLAEERLRLAELGSVSARYRHIRSRAALRVAMGHGIITLEDK